MKIFVDSDVIISSLLSEKGASYMLINEKSLTLTISNLSIIEIEIVIKRLGLKLDNFYSILNRFQTITLEYPPNRKKGEDFGKYVLDKNDAHIIAGAINSSARFLITYNVKDFKTDKIKNDLDIIIMTPGRFLQYLRNRI